MFGAPRAGGSRRPWPQTLASRSVVACKSVFFLTFRTRCVSYSRCTDRGRAVRLQRAGPPERPVPACHEATVGLYCVHMIRVIFLKAAPRPPRQAITPPASGGPGHPVGGHLPPSSGRRGCHPRQRYMISRCHATIEPGTPIVRDGRDNYCSGGGEVACTDPLYVGAGAPPPRGEGHTISCWCARSGECEVIC